MHTALEWDNHWRLRVLRGNAEQLAEGLLEGFTRYEVVTAAYRGYPGNYMQKPVHYTESWDAGDLAEQVALLRQTLDRAGVVLLIEDIAKRNRVVAFAALEGQALGSRGQYRQLSLFHVDALERRQGLGQRLFRAVLLEARGQGIEKLYLSASSSVNTQHFYRRMGCVEALELNSALAALEPYDIQMEVLVNTERSTSQDLIFTAKAFLSDQDLEDIAALEAESHAIEGITYKLELAYKRRMAQLNATQPNPDAYPDEFLCHHGNRLVGYLGAMRTQGISYELNGLVAADYRRQGIFSRLLEMAVAQHQQIYSGQHRVDVIQLLCDRESTPGQHWLRTIPHKPHHTEYEMFLDLDVFKASPNRETRLEPATLDQAPLVNRINAGAFNMAIDAMPLVDPEALKQEGMYIHMLYLGTEVIGKSHLQLIDGMGGIFGLALLPEYKGRGYGKELLQQSVEMLLAMGAQQVFLQVSATNENALRLYLQNGFKITSTMDYLEYLSRSNS